MVPLAPLQAYYPLPVPLPHPLHPAPPQGLIHKLTICTATLFASFQMKSLPHFKSYIEAQHIRPLKWGGAVVQERAGIPPPWPPTPSSRPRKHPEALIDALGDNPAREDLLEHPLLQV